MCHEENVTKEVKPEIVPDVLIANFNENDELTEKFSESVDFESHHQQH